MKWLFCFIFLLVRSVWTKQVERETIRTSYCACGASHQTSSLTLSCGTVATSGHTKPPRVDWYFQVNSSTFLSLNDTNYWFQKYQLSLCKYGHGHYTQFEGPTGFDCVLKEKLRNFTNVYTCSYSHTDIIPMQYRCKISTYQGDKKYITYKLKDILVKADEANSDSSRSCSDPKMACFMPTPQNMSMSFIRESYINITWQTSEKQSFSGCSRPFCNGSRRFRVQLLIFNSMPNSNQTVPALRTSWLKTRKRRNTFLEFGNSLATEKKYYQFRVRNINKTPQQSQDPDIQGDSRITESGICHFEIQRPAVIEEPSLHEEYNVPYGKFVELTCHASGSPPPTVEFFYESQSGLNTTLQQGTLQISRFIYVYSWQQQILFCRGSNTVLQPSPCGELVYTEETRKIIINAV